MVVDGAEGDRGGLDGRKVCAKVVLAMILLRVLDGNDAAAAVNWDVQLPWYNKQGGA